MSRWIVKLLLSAFCLTSVMLSTGHAQDLRIARTVGPYAHGVAVENLKMVEPDSLALSLSLSQGSGVLDAIDPPTGRRISVIDTHLNMDLSLAWQYNDDARFHVAAAASHARGRAFGTFDGGGYEFNDVDIGVRWRLLDQRELGLELGLYSDLVFPTGDSTQLAGGGSTNVHIGTILSQRFDDLTFVGMLGYRHRFKPAKFADAVFRNVVDYRAGLYVPLDWPNWVMFTEIAGLLNATASDTDGTEPAEIYGGVTFGQFTNVSIAYSTGLNDQGGASARRLSLRIAHHFDAQERATVARVQPASAPIAHFDIQRSTASKTPKDIGQKPGHDVVKRSKTTVDSPALRSVDKHSKTPGKPMIPQKARQPSSERTDSPVSPLANLTPSAKKLKGSKALTLPPKRTIDAVKRPPSPALSRVVQVRPTPEKATPPSLTKKKTVNKAKRPSSIKRVAPEQPKSNVTMKPPSRSGSLLKSPTVEAPQKAAQDPIPSLVPKKTAKASSAKSKHSKPTIGSEQSSSGTVQYPLRHPGLNVKPMVTTRAPMTLVYSAGQIVSSTHAFNRMVGELKTHIGSTPGTNQVLIEAYAAPGERAYTPHTHTAQRDAYLLANARSKDVLARLKGLFPQLNFRQAPRIWPSHRVQGNDFWSGVVITPSKGSVSVGNSIQTVTADSGSPLTLNLTLQRAVPADAVDILTDGLDVVIIRIRSINEVRKWVRLKHPAVKRALIHPSYETSNAGILRVRLNGALPKDYQASLTVSVRGNNITVQLPAPGQ